MSNYLTFAGRSTHEFGILISGEGTYDSPERNVDKVEVPGHNGDLLFDRGNYKNIPVKYPAFIKLGMPEKARDFFNFAASLVGYQRLEDTYHPYEYRMAKFESKVSVESIGYKNRSGKFDIEFDCKPQRFLKSGEEPVVYTANGIILNRTPHAAKPYIRIYGTGAGTVGIGSETITISSISSYVDIDCEIMDAFKGATNCNQNVSFTNDIVIPSGEVGISKTGNITRVEITPRWYII